MREIPSRSPPNETEPTNKGRQEERDCSKKKGGDGEKDKLK